MTSDLDNTAPSAGDRARNRAYAKEFWPGMAVYLLLVGAGAVWGHLDGTSPVRFLWALLPLLPALWVVRAVVRHLGRLDDYQRRLQLRGLAVGFGVAMMTALTLGLLEVAGLAIGYGLTGWIVYGLGMVSWGVAVGLGDR